MSVFAPCMAHFGLGETETSLPKAMAGRQVTFTDRDGTDPSLLDSASGIIALHVLNNSGGALVRGTRVRFEDGYLNTQVDTTAGDNETCHGLVDPYVGSGNVPDGSYFNLIIWGMTLALSDGTPTLGAEITGGASGKVKLFPGTPTAAALTARCGAANVDGGDDGDYIRVFFKSPLHFG